MQGQLFFIGCFTVYLNSLVCFCAIVDMDFTVTSANVYFEMTYGPG